PNRVPSRVGRGYEPPARIVIVPDTAVAEGIADLEKAVAEGVEIGSRVPGGIGVAPEVAIGVVGVPLRIASRVGDLGDTPLAVPREEHAHARGVRDAARPEAERVAVRIGDALYPRAAVDDEDLPIGTGILEGLRVVG